MKHILPALVVSFIPTASSFLIPPGDSSVRVLSSQSSTSRMSALRIGSENLSVEDVYNVVDARNQHPAPISAINLAAIWLLGLPLTTCLILPLSLTYQVGKIISQSFGIFQKIPDPRMTPIDSSVPIDYDDVIPRSERKYDIVVMGATGFTGSLCVRHLAKTYGVNRNVKWAIAGRSKAKLEEVKERWAKELKDEEILHVDVIVVDTYKPTTLPALVQNTRAVASTTGPFELYGSPIVEACAKYGTHYADITGEVNWSKHMKLAWEATSKRTGANIVSLCGSDAIPWDLSTFIMEDSLKKEGEELRQVTFVDELVSQASGGTIATLLLNLHGGSRGQPRTDIDPFLRLSDGSLSSLKFSFTPSFVPVRISQPSFLLGLYGGFFALSPANAALVSKGVAQRQLTESLTYKEYARYQNFLSALTSNVSLGLALLWILNPITEFFITRFVLPKSGQGPTMEDMEHNYFGCTVGYGIGSKGTKVETILYFPEDQGYLCTAKMVVESGLCLALESANGITSSTVSKLSEPRRGGFWTPSNAMGHELLSRLQNTGMQFACKIIKPNA